MEGRGRAGVPGEGGVAIGGAASGKFESPRFSGQIGQEIWKVFLGSSRAVFKSIEYYLAVSFRDAIAIK